MGTQLKSKPGGGSGLLRPCLICRRGGRNTLLGGGGGDNRAQAVKSSSSCVASLCTIFGLSGDHPFKTIYERSLYCDPCFEDIREADLTLGKLELLRQSLLRFQNKIYSRLGDNYFQIKDVDRRKISYKELEAGGGDEGIRGRKFTYEDIVKIVYEKLDQESDLWERFSSEGRSLCNPAKMSNSSTQTETIGDCSSFQILPGDDDAGGTEDDAHILANDLGDNGNELLMQDPLSPSSSSLPHDVFNGAEEEDMNQKQVTFTKAPVSFDESEKIYCTYDQQNCKRFFYDEYNLQVHLKSFHYGIDKPHECSLCPKSFVDEAHLKRHHVRVHFSGVPCICERCGKEFGDKSLLRKHIRRMHDKTASHKCTLCTAMFETQEDLEEHEGFHRSRKSPFACVFCPKVLTHSAALKAHSKEHFPDMFHCSEKDCSKVFRTAASLKAHMKSHTSPKILQCEHCSFSATVLSALKSHIMSHSSEKPFTCDECGSSFKFLKNLNAHKRVHSQEKPYSCQICNASFRESSYLRRHEESHSLHPSYECTICHKKFKVQENLKKHTMRVHNNGNKRTAKRKPRGLSSTTTRKKMKPRRKPKTEVEEQGEVEEEVEESIVQPFSNQLNSQSIVITTEEELRAVASIQFQQSTMGGQWDPASQ